MNVKIERLNSTFVKEISYILSTEVKDEDIKFVTITDCDITSDLSYAKVYFTVLDMSKKIDTFRNKRIGLSVRKKVKASNEKGKEKTAD